jgi:hypothetical protein
MKINFKMMPVKPAINTFILLFISAALCCIIFLLLHAIIYTSDDNIKTFYAFKKSFGFYKEVMQRPWKARLFSCIFASLFMPKDQILSYEFVSDSENDYHIKIEVKDTDLFYRRVGIWTVFWLFPIFLLFIILRKEHSIFYLYGIFTAMFLTFLPNMYGRVYPWDMPALFFYCLFIFVTVKKEYKWLVLILPVATGFKETAVILPLIFLVWEEAGFKKRLIYFSVTLLLCIAVKSALGIITQNQSVFFTMQTNVKSNLQIVENIMSVFKGDIILYLLINAGTLFAFFILPTKDKYIICLKIIALIFCFSNLIYGNFHEYRIFLELIPFALYGFDKVLLRKNEAMEPA